MVTLALAIIARATVLLHAGYTNGGAVSAATGAYVKTADAYTDSTVTSVGASNLRTYNAAGAATDPFSVADYTAAEAAPMQLCSCNR